MATAALPQSTRSACTPLSRPPTSFALLDCQPQVEHRRRTTVATDWAGACTVEAATVVHDRNGRAHTLAAVLSPDGARGWARSNDGALMQTAITDGLAGRHAHRSVDGTLHIDA